MVSTTTATISIMYVYVSLSTALPVTIVPPVGSTVSNFNVGESGGFVQVCVQALGTPGVLKREVVVTLSTHDGTAVGKTFIYAHNYSLW